MKINILFGGRAGQGIDKAASLTGEILSEIGYYTFTYRDYGSLIRGGHNFDVLAISDQEISSHDRELDGILAMNGKTAEKHEDQLKEDGFMISEKNFEEPKKFGKSLNMLYVGSLIKKLGLDTDRVKEKIREEFNEEEVIESNIEALEKGYKSVENHGLKLEKNGNKGLKAETGSEAVVQGSIESGLDVYLAYPMTPATPALHLLAGKQDEEDIVTFQPENELAAVNAALGSSHTGAKTMVGTSGGGYDLMQEAMSMQGISEIPLVVYLAQRAGAGSGVPTYTAQGDLGIATKGSHSEFPRVTVAPGDPLEAVEAANQAFYFAENYRVLSVILSDKHLAESVYTYKGEPDITEVGRNIDEGKKEGLYKHYELTEDGNSPRTVPGMNTVKSTSYEHWERGVTTEDKEKIEKMTDKRKRKQETVERETEKFTRYKIHGEGGSDTVILGWGSTKGAIKDAMKDLNVKFLQVIYLEPFPEEIKEVLEEANQVILVENNSTGLLGDLVTENTGYQVKEDNKILKYNGRPFRADELREKIKRKVR